MADMAPPSGRALLVIDVQLEYFTGLMPVTHPAGHFERVLEAIDAARAAGVPVVAIQHTSMRDGAQTFVKGSEGWQVHPEVVRRGWDVLVEKTLPGSFTGTGLDEWLKGHGVGTVVIAGYMTQMCCDTTARQARHLGYDVEFLSDATGTLDFTNAAGHVSAEELHRAALVTQQSAFSTVLSVGDWARRLKA
jgi:nicotinamidase-related amidase